MKNEIEIKFKIDKPQRVRNLLKEKGGLFIGKAFERTIRFDTPNKDLEKAGKFLRIKTGFANTITLKERVANSNYKERREMETTVGDPKEMIMILKKLGFTKTLIMEKYREKWEINKTEVVIDKLPMGNYIEIEGEKKTINKVIEILNLDAKQKILGTYWDLWREFAQENNIKNENIIFKYK
jgi:adenylate cyclase class 2